MEYIRGLIHGIGRGVPDGLGWELESCTSADATLEGIKRWCCYCGDRQGVPETYFWREERPLVSIHRAVWYQESNFMASCWCAGMYQILLGINVNEVVDDLVHHDCLTLFTAWLKHFPSQILNHWGDTACMAYLFLFSSNARWNNNAFLLFPT